MQTSRFFLFSRANSRSPLQKKRHINHIIPLRAGRNAALVSAFKTCIMKLETDDLSGCGEPITLEGVAFSHPGATAPASLPREAGIATWRGLRQPCVPPKVASLPPMLLGASLPRTILRASLPRVSEPHFLPKAALRLIPLFPTPTTIFPLTKNEEQILALERKTRFFLAGG